MIVETSTVQDVIDILHLSWDEFKIQTRNHSLFISFALNLLQRTKYITPPSNMAVPALRSPTFLISLANLFAIGGSTYLLRNHHIYNLEEHDARMDELEGTLRGHIGLIEEALDRLEGNGGVKGKKT